MLSWFFLVFCFVNQLHCSSAYCSSNDDKDNCNALVDFGNALNYKNWNNNNKWLSSHSFCDWEGITCTVENKINYVEKIILWDNNKKGSIPDSIGALSKMDTFYISGSKTSTYSGCNTTNLYNTSLPSSFFNITTLKMIAAEYACLGGDLDGYTNLNNLINLTLHGNYVHGTIPMIFDNNTPNLQILKLGRNPITGTVPSFRNLKELIKFNCNFCALHGQFPDSLFTNLPKYKEAFWDGNGFTGSLPSTIGLSNSLTSISFNLNGLSGFINDTFCKRPPSEDCTIGSDTDYNSYQANYPWLIKPGGNLFKCPLPSCLYLGANCDQSKSIINCTNS